MTKPPWERGRLARNRGRRPLQRPLAARGGRDVRAPRVASSNTLRVESVCYAPDGTHLHPQQKGELTMFGQLTRNHWKCFVSAALVMTPVGVCIAPMAPWGGCILLSRRFVAQILRSATKRLLERPPQSKSHRLRAGAEPTSLGVTKPPWERGRLVRNRGRRPLQRPLAARGGRDARAPRPNNNALLLRRKSHCAPADCC